MMPGGEIYCGLVIALTAIPRTKCAGLRGRGAGAPEDLEAAIQSNAVP